MTQLKNTLTDRRIDFSEEQAMMLESAMRFVEDKSDMTAVRTQVEQELAYKPEDWQEMVGLGWTGIAISEGHQGSGLGLGAIVPVLEQCGRGLISAPLASTVLGAAVIERFGNQDQKDEHLHQYAGEGAIVTLALLDEGCDWDLQNPKATATRNGDKVTLSGTKALVECAPEAHTIIALVSLEGKPALIHLHEGEGSLKRELVVDETRRSYTLCLDGVTLDDHRLLDLSKTQEALKFIELASCLFIAADSAGAANSCLNVIVEYLTTRTQFGKQIGSYQALKHPAADILTGIETARSHLYHAATLFDDDWQAAEVAIRMAKARADEVLAYAGDRAIQFHGGFGFTYECDAHFYRRRAFWNCAHFGGPEQQREKLADLLLVA